MKHNNIVIAPGCSNTSGLYESWKVYNFGTEDQFYEFLTTPSMERTVFLAEHTVNSTVSDNFVMEVFSL